jgi:cell wall-associated NlpC family hydrolase
MRSPRTISAIRPLRSVAVGVALSLFFIPALPLAAGADQVTDKQAEARQVADKLDALSQKVMTLNASFEVANQRLQDSQANIDDAQKRLDQANADLAATQQKLASYAVQAYVSGNDPQSFNAILTSDTSEGSVKSGYIESLSASRSDILDQVASTKAKVTDETAQLKQARDAAQAQADAADAARNQADAAVAEQTKIKSKVDGQLASLLQAEQDRRAAAAAAAAAATAAAAQQAAAAAAAQAVSVTSPHAPSLVLDPNPVSTPPPPPNGGAGAAVAAAMSKIGSPYVWGAAGPSTFDCSGLTLWAWAQAGVSLPHFTGSQLAVARRISISELQAGDLVFFWGPGESGPPGHVGLYIGGGSMVHAPHAGSTVHVDSIYYWSGARMSAGRVG